ncbi:MAG: aldehyde dehydrogenase family protein, partial [Gammaproteobacteria bacterium]
MNQPDRLALSATDIDDSNPLRPLLAKQQAAFLQKGAPSYGQRIDSLSRLRRSIVDHKDQIVESVESDFGHRSHHETLLADVIGLLGEIRHNRKNLRRWMKPKKAHFSPQFMFAKAQIIYQPKGVVGVIGAWNVPVLLTLSP